MKQTLNKPPFSTLFFGLMTIGTVLLLVNLPRQLAAVVFGLTVLVSMRVIFAIRLHPPLPVPGLLSRVYTQRRLVLIDLLIIGLVVWHVGADFRNFDPTLRPPGGEFSYLTNSGAVAHAMFSRTGLIPLWNPLLGFGEPLVDGPFSYIYNPLMLLPTLFAGPLQGGKIVILLHMALMAYGGYVLGWALRLNTPGRLLLAGLLLGSGSMIGGTEHYQMGLSQAYVPWIFASLLWVIRTHDRRAIGLLVVSSVLLINAGTYWYVLPTVIGAVVVVAFHIAQKNPSNGLFVINRGLLYRLFGAAALVLLICGARWLPSAMHHNLIYHPPTVIEGYNSTFGETFDIYFEQEPVAPSSMMIFYHYIMPMSALIALVVGRVFLFGDPHTRRLNWQVLIPAGLLVFWFTLWGQATEPIIKWMYQNVPLIDEWRFPQRIMAAGSFWLAVIAAICFDDLVHATLVRARVNLLRGLAGVVIIGAGAVLAAHIASNWERVSGLYPVVSARPELLETVTARAREPIQLVDTMFDFYDYLPFYDTLARATVGNPDYRPLGAAPTIGEPGLVDIFTPLTIVELDRETDWLVQRGYTIIDSATRADRSELLWRSQEMLTYAFTVEESTLAEQLGHLRRWQTMPIVSYTHAVDTIIVSVPANRLGDVLVLRETNYPGWSVRVNGQAAALQSVDGRLAVRLPEGERGRVVFRYRPTVVFVGSALTLLGIFTCIGYLLRMDQRVFKREKADGMA